MRYCFGLVPAALLLAGTARAADAPLFPFVLPWDDALGGVTDISGWLHKPAGKFGPVRTGDDGHFHAGKDRVRFFGVNLCFGANFPKKDEAHKVAARMAKFGINVVRFHHLDMFTFPGGIRARGARDTATLDPEALDRLDHFIAALTKHGIYTNLNLLVSRPLNAADGLPPEIEQVADWKDRHVVGFFYAPALATQKTYARNLLSRRNAVTGRTYAEDPAVAFVEINNENGLIQGWLGGQVDRLPDVFRADLQRQWNDWLRRHFSTTGALREAWQVADVPLGAELLTNARFAKDAEGWRLERHGQALARVTVADDVPSGLRVAAADAKAVRLDVTRKGAEAWHVQFNQPGLKVQADRPYTLTFWAKADKPLTASVTLGQAHAPWGGLGFSADVRLTTDWQPFRFVVRPSAADDNARVNFSNLGQQEAAVWLAGVSFRPGGEGGLPAEHRIEAGTLPIFAKAHIGQRTPAAQRDWLRFLWETEDAYWQQMQRFLKEDLKVRGVVMGTIVGCSTPNLMARLDAVDTHSYWEHPHFPGRPWDAEDWVVHNRTMVNEAGGTLPGLALRRVLGKPHCVTEYNHSAPNTYGAEGFLLLAAYGALQDWDAIYAFAYSHNGQWDARRFGSFFDIDQHPTKMATLPAAAALFLRGDVAPARTQIRAWLDTSREIDGLRGARAWDLVHGGTVGLARELALVHRIALVPEGGPSPTSKGGRYPEPAGPRYTSDTNELTWDLSVKNRGVVTVNAPKSKGVIGYGGGKRFDLGGVVIAPGATAQDGWSTVTVTVKDGDLARGPARLLVVATGLAENTGMRWKSAAHDSVGRNWGTAPSVVEGVPATVTLPCPATAVKAWALDGRGQRMKELPVTADTNGQAAIALGPQWQTLWYEVELR